ncbi:relaxase/mobilization nuclease domain-containing protein [Clostridium cochlearium]|uniref:relaxase/mobilization nuclease domain-containing protein n=1 Tax=Clostridium cochlearium TaxID=1494 RepID=UPI00241C1F73|nr:relaxase/mobilization nuclease domain-containing protein [Clostridium cochlearium]MBE6065913.1 hypothetical protein [Clostridium cochlearium]
MPYIKRLSVKTSIINSLKYITNNKTITNKKEEDYLSNALKYIAGKHKVHDICGINCSSNMNLAYNQMQLTKKTFNKNDKVQGYHYIQSFKPGEVTPELSMKIGKEFAEKVFKGHQVLIATHIDKGHIHNHFIVNSVNFETGKKLDSSTRTLYIARDISDEISKKYNLSIIHQNKMRKEFKSEYIKHNRQDKYEKIRKDIDKLISNSFNYIDFKLKLAKAGYKVKEGKYLSITPEGYKQGVRTNKLGQVYSKDFLIQRINNKDIDYKNYLNFDLLSQLKRLTRSEKNEKLISFTEQINFITRYNISSINDLHSVMNYIINELKNNEKEFYKISLYEVEFKKIISDVTFLKSCDNKSFFNEDTLIKIGKIKNELKENKVNYENLDELLEKLKRSQEDISIKVTECKNKSINLKEDFKILEKLLAENERDKNKEKEERQYAIN